MSEEWGCVWKISLTHVTGTWLVVTPSKCSSVAVGVLSSSICCQLGHVDCPAVYGDSHELCSARNNLNPPGAQKYDFMWGAYHVSIGWFGWLIWIWSTDQPGNDGILYRGRYTLPVFTGPIHEPWTWTRASFCHSCSRGDLSSVVPLPVGRYMNAFATLPKYVFFTKWCKNNEIILNRKWRILHEIREVRPKSGIKIR